jgi:hypothetical protein
MTAYSIKHKPEIIIWTLAGFVLMMFFAWCFWPRTFIDTRIVAPPSQTRMYLAEDDIELAPLPRAFHPLPLYEERERDVWLPNDLELKKHDDGYYYPRRVE